MMLRKLVALLVAAGCSLSSSAANRVQLGGPRVTKLDWSTRSLCACDLDHDGRVDLAVLNNERARIDLLYQRQPGERARSRRRGSQGRWEPVLEDALFDKESVATGIRMYALAIGDLDNDGRPDLAYTGSPDPLTIRFQSSGGEFERTRVLDIGESLAYIETLLISDLNGDGLQDLAVLTKTRLLIYTQAKEGDLEGPQGYALTRDDCDNLLAFDADGDQIVDLSYQAPNDLDALRFRLGLPGGGFGPEQAFRVTSAGGLLKPLEDGARHLFVRIQWGTGLIEILSLVEEEYHSSILKHVRPRVFSTQTDGKAPASYAIADLDGNGLPDLVVADPKAARLWIQLQQEAGRFAEAAEYPSLAEVRSLAAADLDGDARAELVLASPKERTLAITHLTAEGRMDYPRPLPTIGKPYGVVVADLGGDPSLDIAAAYEDKKKRGIVLLRPSGDGEWTTEDLELEQLKTSPKALRQVDANQDGLTDLAVFEAHEPIHFLLQTNDGNLSEVSADTGFRQGLVDNVEPSAFSTGDVNGDGLPEMLIAFEGYARSLVINANGELEVIDQYNARSNETQLAAALIVDLEDDQAPELVLIESGGNNLQVLRRHRGGVYRYHESAPIGAIDLVQAMVTDLDGSGRPDLLLFGTDRFFWIPVRSRDLALHSEATYESSLEDVSHRLLAVGDLNGDGQQEIVAIDSRESRVLEVLSRSEASEWESMVHFTVFESDAYFEGQRGSASEPSEALIADLTGDGRDDLALLVHDRLLVYPQEPAGQQ